MGARGIIAGVDFQEELFTMAKKKSKSKYTRARSRQQQVTIILTAVIAVIMVLSMIAAMLPPAPILLLPVLF